MKTIISTLAIGSVIVIGGCNKTKTLNESYTTAQNESRQEVDVNVEVEDGEMIVMINGKEQTIDLSEILGNFVLEDMDGSVSIAVMAYGGKDGKPMQWKHFGDAGMDMKVHMMVNGEEVDGLPDGTMEHIMNMVHSGSEGDMDLAFGWTGDDPEHGKPKMMRMMVGGGPEDMGEMRKHMMRMMGEHGNPYEGMDGEWREMHEDRDIPEEQQFIEELSMLDEITRYMNQSSMAMLGIHMIRDQLGPEERLEALEKIIDDAQPGSTSRNAAIIVAIETLQELDRREEATDLMVELVLSN